MVSPGWAYIETLAGEVPYELNDVFSGFAFSVGGGDEDCCGSFGKLAKVLEVVFLWVTYMRSETEFGSGFLGNTNSILFGSTGL